ncbi:mevalonate kinase family protein [Spirosoma oryzicola]|uniref:mevalonate kinase family protein n=1 Tax=Spirosoma oryzicola TaxID=2898794 RepID=UPI001E4CCD37|nr:GHMP kinase [Spirosoma oryzicola]UHG93725.1 GHMP kinase [Spirosoma oryzicola]
MLIETRAYARAGLLGNPSDGFFGKTIAISVRNFGASVTLYESPELIIEAQPQDTNVFRSLHHLRDAVSMLGYHGGVPLLKAAIKKFGEYCETQHIRLPNQNFSIRYSTSIPRQVGLSGSSAIIVATFRALMQFYDVEIPLAVLPNLVLATESEELGITAGLQDRVIQCYEGCVYMDFNQEIMERQGHGKYESIEPQLLPKLYIAYNTDLGKQSGRVHNDVRSRWLKGEPLVVETMNAIADVAREGREALVRQDIKLLNELVNRNFDLRAQIYTISERNRSLIEAARACGASASFTGSGGSIIGLYRDDAMLNRLFVELKKINARVIKPYVV